MTPGVAFLLHHAVDAAAARAPDHEAFRCDGRGLTYAALAAGAARVARVLIDQGVGAGDRVGLYATKGLELPVALYGVLAAGAAYVPIDPTAPAARVRFLLEDCGIRHLVTTRACAARARRVAALVPGVRCLIGADADAADPEGVTCIPWAEVAAAPARAPDVRLVEDDLAYIMYTSGSTGAPKGLMHTHRSGRSYAVLSAREYGVTPADRLGNHSPLHVDMSTFEYLTGPWCGATTVLIPEETLAFPQSVAALIARERLTFWYSVPLALIQLVEQGDLARHDCRTLRWVLFGGEPFPPKHLARLMALWPRARFSNSYGPAEVNQCTAYHVPPGPVDPEAPVPIGPVWPGAEARIVDAAGVPVAVGEPGELLVHAPTMMHGYWARPDLTRAAFVDQAGAAGIGKRFYRTGDLVREQDDGILVFLGRRDRQVKVRGYRVELDEVEAVVAALPGVAEAAAVDVRQDDGTAVIVAAVIPRTGAAVEPAALRRGAAARLPPYAVPSRIEVRAALPRTGAGKIDRRALAREYRER